MTALIRFKPGDKVVCVYAGLSGLTNGTTYTVDELHNNALEDMLSVIEKSGFWFVSRFELYATNPSCPTPEQPIADRSCDRLVDLRRSIKQNLMR